MDPNLDRALENSPVSQDPQSAPEVDLWEPPFERWIRLADSLLGDLPFCTRKPSPRPQTLVSLHNRN
ncbi:MAG TPA: hypothetical protein VLW06_05035 [Terriglobales bacterium]|nr:hypothetical protein [Terriglobales bacterium]